MKHLLIVLCPLFLLLTFSQCKKEEASSKSFAKWVSGMPVFVKSKSKVSEIAKAQAAKRRQMPGFFEQTLVVNDKMITNTTGLKVYLLYNSLSTRYGKIRTGEPFQSSIQLCEADGMLVNLWGLQFTLEPDGIIINTKKKHSCKILKECKYFGTNYNVNELPDGTFNIWENLGKKTNSTELGNFVVHSKHLQCQDTGNNPFKLYHDGGVLCFNGIGNLSFFEYDTNHNGKKDIYLCNMYDCLSRLEIYKITDQ
ncbi:MAG: hypothetical protein V2A54_03195 [Bacteroidota bacterium]